MGEDRNKMESAKKEEKYEILIIVMENLEPGGDL